MSQLEIALDDIYYDLDHQFKVHLFNSKHDINNHNKTSAATTTNDATDIFSVQLHRLLQRSLYKANAMYQDFESNLKSKDEYNTFLMDAFELLDKYTIDFSERINNESNMKFIEIDIIKQDTLNDASLNEFYNYERQLLCEMTMAMEQFEMEYGPCNLQGINHKMMLSEKELEYEIDSMEKELLLHLPSQISHYGGDQLTDTLHATNKLNEDMEYFPVWSKNSSNQKRAPDQYYYTKQKRRATNICSNVNSTRIVFYFQLKSTIWQHEHRLKSTPFHRKHVNHKKYFIRKYIKYKVCYNGLIEYGNYHRPTRCTRLINDTYNVQSVTIARLKNVYNTFNECLVILKVILKQHGYTTKSISTPNMKTNNSSHDNAIIILDNMHVDIDLFLLINLDNLYTPNEIIHKLVALAISSDVFVEIDTDLFISNINSNCFGVTAAINKYFSVEEVRTGTKIQLFPVIINLSPKITNKNCRTTVTKPKRLKLYNEHEIIKIIESNSAKSWNIFIIKGNNRAIDNSLLNFDCTTATTGMTGVSHGRYSSHDALKVRLLVCTMLVNCKWKLCSVEVTPASSRKDWTINIIGNLAAKFDYGEMIVDHTEVLPQLIDSLATEYVEYRRMVSITLSNIASNAKSPKLIGLDILDMMVHVLCCSLDPKCESDSETCHSCPLLVANLAAVNENHMNIVNRAFELVVKFPRQQDIKYRKNTVIIMLENVCPNKHNLPDLFNTGALNIIVIFSFPPDDMETAYAQFQSIAKIRRIAMVRHHAREFLLNGWCIKPIILDAGNNERGLVKAMEVRREAEAALYNLSLSNENGMTMVKSGVINVHINLIDLDNIIYQVFTVSTLTSLTEYNQSVQSRLTSGGCLVPSINHVETCRGNIETKWEVSCCLAILANRIESIENKRMCDKSHKCIPQAKGRKDITIATMHRSSGHFAQVNWECHGDYPIIENFDCFCQELLQDRGICNTEGIDKMGFDSITTRKSKVINKLEMVQ